MTRAEALKEARRRWGRKAAVGFSAWEADYGMPEYAYLVGSGPTFGRFLAEGGGSIGYGETWEDAFRDADFRDAKARSALSAKGAPAE